MRVAVRRLHAAGIEVILDVVYNHTAEGNEMGPTLSFRGLDNSTYYRLVPDNPRHCINDTGTGNTLNLSNARVLQMVMDSLRYWVAQYHVDGFRFDLGVTLGREPYGFDSGRRLLRCAAPGPGPLAREADLRAVGYWAGRLPARHIIRRDSPSGTTAFATASAAFGAVIPNSEVNSRHGSPARATCSTGAHGAHGPRSITRPHMTATRSRTS